MHKRVTFFSYPFERHAMVHHQIFKADETYHLINEEDKYTIPMAWWNGPAIIAVGIIPFIVAAVLLKSWGLICGSLFACCSSRSSVDGGSGSGEGPPAARASSTSTRRSSLLLAASSPGLQSTPAS